jgi:hypothetical protein
MQTMFVISLGYVNLDYDYDLDYGLGYMDLVKDSTRKLCILFLKFYAFRTFSI